MDPSKAHLITLWCAVLAKSDRGVTRVLPKDMPTLQFRVLGQLGLPNIEPVSSMHLARMLVVKPQDAQASLDILEQRGLVEKVGDPAAASDRYALTAQGAALSQDLLASVTEYLEACRAGLSPQDRTMLATMLANALTRPGSYYTAQHVLSPQSVLEHPIYRLTAFAMMRRAIASTVKTSLDLSLTDFRFLLELYPKKPGVDKRLRAKDLVAYLQTGRSYVATAAQRLERDGLIERIPDPDDARGVLYRLTPTGSQAVREVGEDVFAVFTALASDYADDRQFINALKLLLKGQDAVYTRLEAGHGL